MNLALSLIPNFMKKKQKSKNKLKKEETILEKQKKLNQKIIIELQTKVH